MDFSFTPEQSAWREQFQAFAAQSGPELRECEAAGNFPQEAWNQLAEKGWLGLPLPIDYGGREADFLSFLLATEELSRVSPSLGQAYVIHTGLTALSLCRFASEAQKVRWVNSLATGEALGAFASGRSGPGEGDAAGPLTATQQEGGNLLDGTCEYAGNGAGARQALVFATLAPESSDSGLSAFVVEEGAEGFTRGAPLDTLGFKAAGFAQLKFENCLVTAEQMVGAPGGGGAMLAWILDRARLMAAAQALGLARAALGLMQDSALLPGPAGIPLAREPRVIEQAALAATRVSAARWLTCHAATLCDQGQPFSAEAAMARRSAEGTALIAAESALQMLGIRASLASHPAVRLYNDALALSLQGKADHTAASAIGQKVLGGVP